MNSIFGADTLFGKFMNKLWDVIVLSVLWVLFSVPVFTIGASTCSAYYCAAKVLKNNTGYVHREFIRAFKQNFRQAFMVNIILLVFTTLLVLNFMYFYGMDTEISFYARCVYIVMALLVAAFTGYVYPVMSRFSMKTKSLMLLSFQLMFRHIGTTFMIDLGVVILVFGVYMMPWSIFVFPGAVMYAFTYLMERILRKYMPKTDKTGDKAEYWYYQS